MTVGAEGHREAAVEDRLRREHFEEGAEAVEALAVVVEAAVDGDSDGLRQLVEACAVARDGHGHLRGQRGGDVRQFLALTGKTLCHSDVNHRGGALQRVEDCLAAVDEPFGGGRRRFHAHVCDIVQDGKRATRAARS